MARKEPRRVADYARRMQAGEWTATDVEPTLPADLPLLDGQNRLDAKRRPSDTGQDQAEQTRYEQYVLSCIAFSYGEITCRRCGRHSRPMTYDQWVAELRRHAAPDLPPARPEQRDAKTPRASAASPERQP
jgi:hypothetical protein